MDKLCKEIVEKLKGKNKTISFMESCTGGYLANQITNISGASDVLKVSLVTYSNEYKIKLGVNKDIIDEYTVYSRETAQSMAKTVADFANSNIGVGITGKLGNAMEEENIVYYTVYNNDTKQYINKKIKVKLDKRENMKKEVAKQVLQNILEVL